VLGHGPITVIFVDNCMLFPYVSFFFCINADFVSKVRHFTHRGHATLYSSAVYSAKPAAIAALQRLAV